MLQFISIWNFTKKKSQKTRAKSTIKTTHHIINNDSHSLAVKMSSNLVKITTSILAGSKRSQTNHLTTQTATLVITQIISRFHSRLVILKIHIPFLNSQSYEYLNQFLVMTD